MHWCRAGWGQAMRDSRLPDTDQGGRSSIATPNIPSKKLPCIETEGGQYGRSSKEAKKRAGWKRDFQPSVAVVVL